MTQHPPPQHPPPEPAGEHELCEDPRCGVCVQRRASAAFAGEMLAAPGAPPTGPAGVVPCPNCGCAVPIGQGRPVRVTETTALPAAVAAVATTQVRASQVAYADPERRFPVGTEDEARESWNRASSSANTASPPQLVRARIKAALHRADTPVTANALSSKATEATINGKRSFDDLRELVRRALRARKSYDDYCWTYIVDISDTDVVYMGDGDRLWQCTWSISDDGPDATVTLDDPHEVVRTYAPVSTTDTGGADDAAAIAADVAAAEAGRGTRVTVASTARVLEAKGTDAAGNRIFRVRIIAYGDSKNLRRYPESVLRKAAPLYAGAKAFDHHRSEEEMRSGTIAGLVGYYRSVEAGDIGIEADLHLLPSATHAAEALDAALALEGEDPLVGISHDAYATFRSITENGQAIQEATEITAVASADIVAHPAAGGAATRVVASSTPDSTTSTTEKKEPDVPPTKAEVLAAFKEASDDELAAVGLARAGTTTGTGEKSAETETTETKTTETMPGRTTEAETWAKDSFLGRTLISGKVTEAELPASVAASIAEALPDRISESDVDAQIAAIKTTLGSLERAGLAPASPATVTKEAHDKKVAALDAFFDGKFTEGYRSFRQAWEDFTGHRPRAWDEDINRVILRESLGIYSSARSGARAAESLTTASWDNALGDSITRRMMKFYAQPSLQNWRKVVSEFTPVSDFRTQRRIRVGGYGLLPIVGQSAPYQPLTSPTDEEAVYAVMKRGGTEDLTFEMIANDDIGAIRNIPRLLGLAAAITLYRFVWDMLPSNLATTYDATLLFHANHNNTAAGALAQLTLSAARRAMRRQTAYGDQANVLSIVPRTLIVPPDLEEIAFQLATSAVAIPAGSNASDIPNLHQNLDYEVIDYYADTNDWYLAADPMTVPLIEMGFYGGREDPELFTQADPNVGSMFDADKVTYKIRHIYSGTVLDHRGFYRSTN